MMSIGNPELPSGAGLNISRHLGRAAAEQPNVVALKVPRGRTRTGEIDYLSLSFQELDWEVGAWCDRLNSSGLRAGDRTLVMVPPGLPLIAAVFAVFNRGGVPVVIDPGMGLRSFFSCVVRAQPRVLVGIPFARLLSRVFRRTFRSVQIRVGASGSLDGRLAAKGATADRRPCPPPVVTRSDDLAAILFTSGSTGAPKGVCYQHGMFDAQVQSIRDTYRIEPGEIDLPLLPVFALFNPALGMTTIVPEINPRRPARLDPAKIVQAIQQEHVTNSFGSPTLWLKISAYCRSHGMSLPSLRRVLCAGAAVPAGLWKDMRSILPHGRFHSPYGATEALPVSNISAEEVDPASLGGACVGHPVPGMEVKIIALCDEPIPLLTAASQLPAGEVGEIIVKGPVVTRIYDALPQATALAKIADGSAVWHRMGDCGFFDDVGRLWFCGRKAERVQTTTGTLYTEPCERVFLSHPAVLRCALVGLGTRPKQQPALVVEAQVVNSAAAHVFVRELKALALRHTHTAEINTFFFHPHFPVDVRHNAKIHRLALARWALTARSYSADSNL